MKQLVILLSILSIIGCTPARRTDEIIKIELASTNILPDSGSAISIDNSFVYKYYGQINTKEREYYIGQINPELWDSINVKLESLNLKTVQEIDLGFPKTTNRFELIVYWKNDKRRLLRTQHGASDPTIPVFEWLSRTYKRIRLKKSDRSFKFDVFWQNPPILNTTVFPPPIK